MATTVDEPAVRVGAQAFCDALAAGDIDQALESLSQELRRNPGEVLALLPLPANDVTLESIDRSGAGFNVAIRLLGETDETVIQTRWKDRDGRPTLVEASHLSRMERGEPTIEEDGAALDDESS